MMGVQEERKKKTSFRLFDMDSMLFVSVLFFAIHCLRAVHVDTAIVSNFHHVCSSVERTNRS